MERELLQALQTFQMQQKVQAFYNQSMGNTRWEINVFLEKRRGKIKTMLIESEYLLKLHTRMLRMFIKRERYMQ